MSVNRYDVPIGQKYVSSYVPLPLEEIGQMAKQYSQAHLAGKEAPHALDQLDQALKAAPIHYEKKKALMDRYHSQMNDIVSNAKPEDYAKPEYQQKINNLVYQFKNDPEVNQIMNTKQWWDKEYLPYVNKNENNRSLVYDIHETSPGSGQYNQTMNEVSRLKTTPYEDWNDTAKKVMGNIAKEGSTKDLGIDFNNIATRINNGETEVYVGGSTGWTGVSKDKVERLSKIMASQYGNTNAGKHHLQTLLKDELGDNAYNLDYKTLEKNAQIDPQWKEVKDQVDNIFMNHMFESNANQIGGESTKKLDYHFEKNRAAEKANDKVEQSKIYNNLPAFEGNIPATPINDDKALELVGVTPLKYNNFNFGKTTSEDILKEVNNLKEVYKGNESSPDYLNELNRLKNKLADTKDNQKIANDHYSSMVNSAVNLGIDLKQFTSKDGKVNYDALKNTLVDYGKQLGTQAPTLQGLQKDYADNLTSLYFGKHTDKGFEQSPFFQKLAIYENNNEDSKYKIEGDKVASQLAENGRFVALDFNDPNLGAMAFTATKGKEDKEPKLYTAVTNDKVLKQYMEPLHHYTQQINNVIKGKQSEQELFNNKKEALTTLVSLKDIIYNSKDPNGDYKIKELDKLFNLLANKNTKGITYGTNAAGDKIFIGQPRYNNGTIENNSFVIDVKTGEIINDAVPLGKLQNEESTYIQSNLAPALNENAPGYIPRDIKYK